jgi:hypothetical protein
MVMVIIRGQRVSLLAILTRSLHAVGSKRFAKNSHTLAMSSVISGLGLAAKSLFTGQRTLTKWIETASTGS